MPLHKPEYKKSREASDALRTQKVQRELIQFSRIEIQSLDSADLSIGRTVVERGSNLKAFKEILAFFEIQESTYINMCCEDATDRATHDVVLYISKFFPADKQAEYLKLFKKYISERYQTLYAQNIENVLAGDEPSSFSPENLRLIKELLLDSDFAVDAISKNPIWYEYLSEKSQEDEKYALAAVKKDRRFYELLPKKLRLRKQILIAVLQQNGWDYNKIVPKELTHDREIVMAAVSKTGGMLDRVPSHFWDDKEVVIAAVRSNGYALRCASKKLQNDKEVAMAAVINGGDALEYISLELRGDKEVVMAAISNVERTYMYFQWVSEELRNDPEVVMAAAMHNVRILMFASNELRSNRTFMTALAKIKPCAINYVTGKLKEEIEPRKD